MLTIHINNGVCITFIVATAVLIGFIFWLDSRNNP